MIRCTAPLEAYPSSWSEANRIGSVYYFTGNPCPRGHVDLRRAQGGECKQCHFDYVNARNKRLGYWRIAEARRQPRNRRKA